METYYTGQLLLSGILAGFILFQSAIVAPTVFTVVPEDSRGPLLRALFPKLFKVMVLLGTAFLVCAILRGADSLIGFVVAGLTIASGVVCHAMIPATNQARDSGDDKKFALLHRLSVLFTLGVLFAHLFWSFLEG